MSLLKLLRSLPLINVEEQSPWKDLFVGHKIVLQCTPEGTMFQIIHDDDNVIKIKTKDNK